jgi:hypothetical protein
MELREHSKTACIGCRLRRKKCDKQRPCSTCKELQIPPELCIYRKIGLISKDSKATLSKELHRNRELKDEIGRLKAIMEYNSHNSLSKEYFYLNNHDRFKHFQLNPEKNPLLCTVMSSPQSLAYLGSISVAAITQSEPKMRLLLQQIHTVIMNEKLKLERQLQPMMNTPMLDIFQSQCHSKSLGLGVQEDETIIRLIQEIETTIPKEHHFNKAMNIIFRTNVNRWTLVPYIDEASFHKRLEKIIQFDHEGSPHFHIGLSTNTRDLNFIAMVLSMLSLCAFSFQQSKVRFGLDHVLYAKYVNALLRIDGVEIKYTETDLTYERILTMYVQLLLEKYTATGGFLNSFNEICEGVFNIRSLISMALSIHLNSDLEKWYPMTTQGEKRSMKSLWYVLVLFEIFESLDLGFISKLEPSSFKRYDYCYNPLIETIHVVHGVIFSYNMIDDGQLDKFVQFVETELIKRLKQHLKDEYCSMKRDMTVFQLYDLDNLDQEHLKEYAMILQRLAMRFLILGVILSLYHVCCKRLEQTGTTGTDQLRRLRLLGWKYSLTIQSLCKEMWIGYSRVGTHPNFFNFYPTASLMMMAPILRFSQRRVTLFAISKLLEMLDLDEMLIANHILYGDNQKVTALLQQLKSRGQLENLYKIEDFEDLDIDDDINRLIVKFGALDNVRTLVLNFSNVTFDILSSMHSQIASFNFMKLSKIFHVVLLKLCGFLLNSGPLSIEDKNFKNFNFKQFLDAGVTMDDDIYEVFKMTSQSKFW